LDFLSIPGLVQPGVDMSPLKALTALTGLGVGGVAVDDNAASMVLAQLTGLHSLGLYYAPHITDQGLLALSALRRLTELWVWDCGASEALAEDNSSYEMNVVELKTIVSCRKCFC
jgi:hypothetical protein